MVVVAFQLAKQEKGISQMVLEQDWIGGKMAGSNEIKPSFWRLVKLIISWMPKGPLWFDLINMSE